MRNAYLHGKIQARAELADLMAAPLEKAAKENRDLTDDEKTLLNERAAKAEKLDAEIAELEVRAAAHDKFMATVGRVSQAEEKQEERQVRDRGKPTPETRSAGSQFVESDQFKAYRGRGSMEPIEFAGFLEKRAAITLESLDGFIPAHQYEVTDPALRTPLLDVIGREVVGVGSVEYISWSATPTAGGPIAEGEVKPEAELTPKIVPVALETYAHWKAITRQALEDYPRIRSIVETQLRFGLAKKLEAVAAEVVLAAAFPALVNADLLAGARQGIATVQAAGYEPNAILMNPTDYANADLAAADGAGNGPVLTTAFWGLRPVAVPGIPVGTQYVGDFSQAVTWFDRNTTAVYLTDSHADYMVRNLLLVLAEQRAAFAATNPAAAVKITAAEPPAEPVSAKAKA